MKQRFTLLAMVLLALGLQAQNYQPIITKKEPVTDTFYTKYVINDDYRWLENTGSDEVKAWIKKENRQSKNYLKKIKDEDIYEKAVRYNKVKIPTFSKSKKKYKFRLVYDYETTTPVLQFKGPGYETYKTITLIDAVWFDKGTNNVACAFEVEKSTSIYSGILRLTDLHYSFKDNPPTLYLIIPDNREKEVIHQLQRPSIKNSNIEIHYILFSELKENCDAICKFGEDKEILKKISKVVS